MLNYTQLLRAAGRTYRSRIAIDDAGASYTYGEVDRATASLAAGLRSVGLVPGDAVIWLSPNTVTHLIAHWGTARAGLRFSPLNYYLRPSELRAAIELVQPKLVFGHSDYIETLDGLADELGIGLRYVVDRDEALGSWPSWRELLIESSPDEHLGGREDSPHEIIFTSGTTGQVKGVARTQRERILESLVSIVVNPQGKDARVLRGSPQFHVGGSTGPLQTLLQGGRTTIYKFRPDEMVEHIKAGITHIAGVPAQYAMVFDSGLLEGVDVSRVRSCAVGANGASPAQFMEIQNAFPNARLAHHYGSTESGMITAITDETFMQRLSSIGRPAPGVEMRIVDDNDRDVPPGEVGEIIVRSDWLMSEYIRREDLTEAAFAADGYLRMGDLARQDEEGFVYIAGRKKDMIITGGENVFPKEVEDVITALDFVAEVAVVGAPDPVFEERVVAVVRRSEVELPDRDLAAEIIEDVRTHLAGYKAPKNVFFVEDFPRNAMGKIDKVALRAQYETVATA